MAGVSFQILNTGVQNLQPDTFTVGANAPTTAGSIEIRIDTAGGWTLTKIKEALEMAENFINDGRFTFGANFVGPGK